MGLMERHRQGHQPMRAAMNETVQDRRWLALTPTLMAIAGVVLLLLPLRLFGGFVPTPIIPLAVIFFWSLYEPDFIPYPIVFLIGLLQDFLTGGTVGVWASVYLFSQWLILQQRKYFLGREQHVVWLGFSIIVAVISVIIWLEQSLLTRTPLPYMASLWQWVVTIAIYPLLSIAFSFLHKRAIMEEE